MARLANAYQGSLDLFCKRLPASPYCSDNLVSEGLYRLPLADAMERLLIQPNTSKLHVALCFDVDRELAAIDWEWRGLPPPNLVVKNPSNGHAHLIYLLEAPVPVSEIARIKPLQFMAAVQEGIRRKLESDRGYAGLIVKNPKHQRWQTTEYSKQAYELSELAEYVDLPTPAEMRKRVKSVDYAGLGRNCTIFEIVRRQSYSMVRDHWRPNGQAGFESAVFEAVFHSNHSDIGNPLGLKECKAIARSIAKWTWRHFTPQQFRTIQAVRGKAKGSAKRTELLPQAKALAAEGHSLRAIGKALGVSFKTVDNWLKLRGV